MSKLEALKTKIQNTIESATDRLDKFAADMKSDPLYTMAWADSVFDAAAQASICRKLHASILANPQAQEDELIAKLHKACVERVLGFARNPPSSTSQASNRADIAEAKVYADLVEVIDWL